MTRAAHHLLSAACAFALACSHEASAPSASALRDAPRTTLAFSAPEAPPTRTTAGCIDVDDAVGASRDTHITLEGHVLVDDTYEHPTRGKTHPYILRLDQPRCAVGTDEARISELHLTSLDGLPLKALTGKHVRVSGDPFSAHTAWHARPIVLMTTKATALP